MIVRNGAIWKENFRVAFSFIRNSTEKQKEKREGGNPMENTNVLFARKRLIQLIVLLIVVFTSMASGGSVVGAQFLGSGDKETACHAAEQLVMICGLIALVICGISFFGNRQILHLVYGSVEEQVMTYAAEYFFITSLSFPFLGIYNAGAALFRVMGNSNISMITSIVMNGLNIIGNAVFVYGFGMGVAGVALSTLISRAFASIVILVLLHQPKYEIHCTKWFLVGWDGAMLKKIFSIGVPQAMQNSR